jgi:cell wall-associated NlpC family hydrolase
MPGLPRLVLVFAGDDLVPALVRFAAGAILLITLPVLTCAVVVGTITAALGGGLQGNRPADVPSQVAVTTIPADQLAVMQQSAAAAPCPLNWSILAGIARVESGFGSNMAISSAGAVGYGQFLPATWAAYGDGGDPYDYRDALPAIARYLCASGAGTDIRHALFAYNHADWYIDEVLGFARQYAATPAQVTIPTAGSASAVDLARTYLNVPYLWGGISKSGIDCSGLVMAVYARLGVALPHNAQLQYDRSLHIPESELRPGDLVFFARTYPSTDPITHVGVYEGNGLMINAPDDGDVVRELPVWSGFWGAHYAGAGRVFQ